MLGFLNYAFNHMLGFVDYLFHEHVWLCWCSILLLSIMLSFAGCALWIVYNLTFFKIYSNSSDVSVIEPARDRLNSADSEDVTVTEPARNPPKSAESV